jgi:hypothetical protein
VADRSNLAMDRGAIEALFERCPDAVLAWVDDNGWLVPAIGTAHLNDAHLVFHATGRIVAPMPPPGVPACCVAEESASPEEIRAAIGRGRLGPGGPDGAVAMTVDVITSFDFAKAR